MALKIKHKQPKYTGKGWRGCYGEIAKAPNHPESQPQSSLATM